MSKVTKNIIASIIYIITSMLTNFIVQQRILVAFGSDINGISSSVSQFLSYLALLEAGLGAASIQALYKPLSKNSWNEVNSILTATKKQYYKVALFFFIALLIVSLILPILVSGQLDAIFVVLFTIISGLNTLLSYTLVGKYSVFLNANRKVSVLYFVDSVVLICACILKITAINMGMGILLVQFLSSIFTCLKALILWLYIRSKYKLLNMGTTPDYNKLKKRKSVLVHTLAGIVVNHTDITLLTAFSSLKNVSLYAIYNLIYNSISSIMNTVFSSAVQGTFGHLATKGKTVYKEFYCAFEFLFTMVLYAVLTIAIVLTLPFVTLYTQNVPDMNYISKSIAILFCINMLMNLVRIPSIVTIQAYGWFKETQKGALIEAIINIIVSLCLMPFLNIQGLLIGTFCSYLFRTQDTVLFVYRQCGISKKFLLKNNLINLLIAVIFVLIFMFWKPLNVSGWASWFITAVIVALIIIAVFLVVNILMNRKAFKKSISIIFNNLIRKKGED